MFCRFPKTIQEVGGSGELIQFNVADSSDSENESIVDNYYHFYAEREKPRKKPKRHHRRQPRRQHKVEPIREIYNPEPMSDRPDLNNCVPCKPCKC